jgi:pyruvate/oxaloacetate carboxyltransferase
VIKLTEQKELSKVNKDLITIALSVVIMTCTAIVASVVYNLNDRNNMAKNIEAAIAKGVDPLSVKCAYDTSPSATCITYALTSGSGSPIVSVKK